MSISYPSKAIDKSEQSEKGHLERCHLEKDHLDQINGDRPLELNGTTEIRMESSTTSIVLSNVDDKLDKFSEGRISRRSIFDNNDQNSCPTPQSSPNHGTQTRDQTILDNQSNSSLYLETEDSLSNSSYEPQPNELMEIQQPSVVNLMTNEDSHDSLTSNEILTTEEKRRSHQNPSPNSVNIFSGSMRSPFHRSASPPKSPNPITNISEDFIRSKPVRRMSPPMRSIPTLPPERPRHFKCPKDIKILCRLIAAHQKKPQPKSFVKFFVDGETHEFRTLLNVDIGQNVRCLAFERKQGLSRVSLGQSFELSEVIFAFNWFSPTGLWDYLSLGLKLLVSSSGIGTTYNMCGDVPMHQALSFLCNPEIRDLLQDLKLGYIPEDVSKAQHELLMRLTNENESSHNLTSNIGLHSSLIHANKITVTGFSMGGSTAHAFAVLLKEAKNIPQNVRCVGFGCPRPGNEELGRWIKQNLTPDSLNIILASEEYIDCPLVDQRDGRVRSDDFVRRPPAPSTTGCVGCRTDDDDCQVRHLQNGTSRFIFDSFVDPADGPRVLFYDPVTRTPSATKGFDVHPNAHVVIQCKGGYLNPMSDHEKARLKHLDIQESTDASTFSAILNIATRGSPFAPEMSKGIDNLHSVLKYYEALCGAD